MSSPIDVANLALDRLGQPNITAFTDGNKAANLCNRIYPTSRDQVQRVFPWRRLKARALLASDATAPAWGYTARYRIPADTLSILDVYVGGYPLKTGWELEGQYILCNQTAALQIRYIASNDDPSEWDALLFSAVAAHMAAEMAESLTQDATKRAQATGWLDAILKEARHASAQEGTPEPLNYPDRWETVRLGGDDLGYRPISQP